MNKSIERGQAFLDSLDIKSAVMDAIPPVASSNAPTPSERETRLQASPAEHPRDEEKDKQNQASSLVAFVEQQAELFHDSNKVVYARNNITGETVRIDGQAFRDSLVASFYAATGKSPREQSVREALSTLAGRGRFHGDCRDVYIRIAKHGESYFLDLAQNGNSRAVRIADGHWEIISDPPVRFIRPETQRPLPDPLSGGDLSILWRLINIPKEAQLLVIAWLGECLRPDTPFPLMELIGEQGSAKSTTQTGLRRLIDPNACNLRSAPKSVEDVFVSASSNCMVSYENISHLSPPMQDAMCVVATGGGFAKRKLYSDADESVINVQRPIILNGISAAVTAQDLIDRTVSIELPVIRERTEMTDIWRIYDAEHGRLLGALLDVVSAALARLPSIHLPPAERPRLAEFARFGMAVAEALGHPGSSFMAQFNHSRQESLARTIDASPVASAMLDWFEANHRRTAILSVKTLFEAVERYRSPNTDAWPRSPKGFGDAIRRAAPALRQLGMECRSLGKVGGIIQMLVEAVEPAHKACPVSPDHPDERRHDLDNRTCRTSTEGISSASGMSVVEVEV